MIVEKLSTLSIRAVWKMVIQRGTEENKMGRFASYFESLPYDYRDDILNFMVLHKRVTIGGTYCTPAAHHVALFLHDKIEALSLIYGCENFNLDYLLTISGDKLKNLKGLLLPCNYPLTAEETKKLCERLIILTPNLRELNVELCDIRGKAYSYIAALPLNHLHTPALRDEEVKYLCDENSKLKDTLKELHTDSLSRQSYCLVLTKCPQLEEIDHGLMTIQFKYLARELGMIELNLRRVEFEYVADVYEEEMDLAALMCPKIEKIRINSKSFTQNMIKLLAKFKYLSVVHIDAQSDDDDDDDLNAVASLKTKKSLSDEITVENFALPNLRKFTLTDTCDKWISPGYFIMVVEMCPNIEILELADCSGFSNRVATELTRLMWNRKLKHLIIDNCKLLLIAGIDDLSRIPSLQQMDLHHTVNEFNRPYLQSFINFDEKYNSRGTKRLIVRNNFIPL